MELQPKELKESVAVHHLLSGFLSEAYLPRVSYQSTNDKGDNEMIPGAVHRSPGIYLTSEENLSQETDDEGCRPVIA